MSRNSDTALAFLLGAVTGGIVALLLAPDKGENTRRKLREGAVDIYGRGRDWTGEKTHGARNKAADAAGWVKDKVGHATDRARDQVESVKSAVAEGKEAYRREMEKGPQSSPGSPQGPQAAGPGR